MIKHPLSQRHFIHQRPLDNLKSFRSKFFGQCVCFSPVMFSVEVLFLVKLFLVFFVTGKTFPHCNYMYFNKQRVESCTQYRRPQTQSFRRNIPCAQKKWHNDQSNANEYTFSCTENVFEDCKKGCLYVLIFVWWWEMCFTLHNFFVILWWRDFVWNTLSKHTSWVIRVTSQQHILFIFCTIFTS